MLAVASVAAEGPDVALTNFNCQALVERVQATSHDDFKAMLDANNGNKVFALLYRLYEDCLKIMSVEKVGTGAGRKGKPTYRNFPIKSPGFLFKKIRYF